jgi:hypothetical protein
MEEDQDSDEVEITADKNDSVMMKLLKDKISQ